jgi:hypothetical protein
MVRSVSRYGYVKVKFSVRETLILTWLAVKQKVVKAEDREGMTTGPTDVMTEGVEETEGMTDAEAVAEANGVKVVVAAGNNAIASFNF